jgi:hypothetical protein
MAKEPWRQQTNSESQDKVMCRMGFLQIKHIFNCSTDGMRIYKLLWESMGVLGLLELRNLGKSFEPHQRNDYCYPFSPIMPWYLFHTLTESEPLVTRWLFRGQTKVYYLHWGCGVSKKMAHLVFRQKLQSLLFACWGGWKLWLRQNNCSDWEKVA